MVADGLAVGLLDLVAHRTRTEGYQKANNGRCTTLVREGSRGAPRKERQLWARGKTRDAHVVLCVEHRTGDTVIYSLT